MTNKQWAARIDRYIAEGRTVSGGKGDQTVKASEDASLQNQQQQMDFSQKLMGIFQQQYGDQKGVLDYIKSKMEPQVENPTGYSPDAEAAMRTSASDTNAGAYQHAQQALQAQRFALGGRDLPSGVDAQLSAGLASDEAAQEAGSQNAITQSNEDLKQRNYWNSLNVLGGSSAQMAPQSYAGSAEGAAGASSGAADATANDANAYASSKKGFFTTLAGSLASGLGSSLGGLGFGVGGLSVGGGRKKG